MSEEKAVKLYEKARGLHEQGKLSQAERIYKKAIKADKHLVPAYNNLGNVLVDRQRLAEATYAYKNALTYAPDNPTVLNNLGNVLYLRGMSKEAIDLLNRAIDADPDYSDALNNLGNALSSLGRLNEATTAFNRAIQLAPNTAQIHFNLGRTFSDAGKTDSAIASFDRAIVLDPNYSQAYYSRGNALQELGQFQEAVESYQQAIRIEPDASIIHLALSRLKKYTETDPQIAVMLDLLGNSRQDDSSRTMLCFALAKAYDDTEQYDRSFSYLHEGNRLRSKKLGYNLEDDRFLVSKIKGVFDSDLNEINPISCSELPNTPIFVVGMPRSGTSLVEQILASHAQVYGAGELDTVNASLRSSILQRRTERDPKCEGYLLAPIIERLRSDYLATLSNLNTSEPYMVDKMPLNFLWGGFILEAFPEAKIIHTKRSPQATCWSIYQQHFAADELGFAYDLTALAGFHGLYLDLMHFWRIRYPNRIYDLVYEELTENQNRETASLLAFCGLEWDPNCLNFHNTERLVKTASDVQVRQKLYTGSSEKWKNYKKHLDPLLKNLGG